MTRPSLACDGPNLDQNERRLRYFVIDGVATRGRSTHSTPVPSTRAGRTRRKKVQQRYQPLLLFSLLNTFTSRGRGEREGEREREEGERYKESVKVQKRALFTRLSYFSMCFFRVSLPPWRLQHARSVDSKGACLDELFRESRPHDHLTTATTTTTRNSLEQTTPSEKNDTTDDDNDDDGGFDTRRSHLLSTPKSLMMGMRIDTHRTGAVWLLISVERNSPDTATTNKRQSIGFVGRSCCPSWPADCAHKNKNRQQKNVDICRHLFKNRTHNNERRGALNFTLT